MAVTVRNNRLEYNSAVNLRGGECDRGIEDLVIDSNLFEDCRCAIYAEGRGSNILVSGNSFVNCEKDIIFTDEETAERTLILK
jgi:nitrous oxidase accessory protein NosD